MRVETREALREAGWSPSRKTSPWRWFDFLLRQGYEDFPAARWALTSVGGLRVAAHQAIGPNYPNSDMLFDPLLGAWDNYDDVYQLMDLCGSRVFPLGLWDIAMTPMIDESSAVYAFGAFGTWRVGASMEEFLDKVVCAEDPIEIIEP
ncbi:hypothetical protein GCM10022254_40820 [Actinomadura meridiana]|uniref:Knr4/Smi1-like domain-containing protein n=1 Tax=Actinomadura meridiana TaxID=559626 RepID=A0ABP8C782_9ACTN